MSVSGHPLPDEAFVLAWPEVLKKVDQYGIKEALVSPSARLSYQALVREVFHVQRALAARGLKAGDRLVVMLGNDGPYLSFYWAALASGIIFVPLNTRLARPEIAPILHQTNPSLILVEDHLQQQIPQEWTAHQMTLTNWHVSTQSVSSDYLAPYAVSPDDVAVILYTSGTTGQPKGVMLTQRNIAVQFYQTTTALVGVRPSDRVISLYPIFHTAQHVFLQAPLTVGATVIIEEFSPKRVHGLIQREAVTIFFGVPAMYHILLQDPTFRAETFPHLRLLAYGASIMPMDTIHTLKQRFPQAEIRNLYGQTENSPAVSGLEDRYALTKPGSVGLPLPGMTIAIFNEHDQEVEPGVVGEVVTQGINLMKGYLNNPDATAEVVRNGWYHTGDLGYVDNEGFLYIVDRKKDMIIRGGQNIYPAEVENVLHTHPDIVECAVIGVPHPIYGEEVAAVMVLKPGAVLTGDTLHLYLRDRLAKYKIPVHYHVLDGLPHNASGKILKRELREMAYHGIL